MRGDTRERNDEQQQTIPDGWKRNNRIRLDKMKKWKLVSGWQKIFVRELVIWGGYLIRKKMKIENPKTDENIPAGYDPTGCKPIELIWWICSWKKENVKHLWKGMFKMNHTILFALKVEEGFILDINPF
jgi:hypothetical protein